MRKVVFLTSEILELEDVFSTVRYDGDYGFDELLAGGGASSDGEVVAYLAENGTWHTMLPGIIRGALWNMTMPQILKLLAGRHRIIYIAATDGRYSELWLWEMVLTAWEPGRCIWISKLPWMIGLEASASSNLTLPSATRLPLRFWQN